jgi:hypothetical protein
MVAELQLLGQKFAQPMAPRRMPVTVGAKALARQCGTLFTANRLPEV